LRCKRLGIPPEHVLFGYSPEQKHSFIENLEKQTNAVFVGDGLNDGLALLGTKPGSVVKLGSGNEEGHAVVLKILN
tara:strand:- start:1623 stop:1850 length:228 start_codon:yes stop_codon:yes gene_type:complete